MTMKYSEHTSQAAFCGGMPIAIPNRTDEVKTDSPHWHISYLSTSGDYGCPTTALVIGQSEYFLILKGDHRQGFQDAIDHPNRFPKTRISACLEYIRQHRNEIHERFSDSII